MLAPAVTIGCQPPQSPWIAGTTWSVIQANHALCARARCSRSMDRLDQEAPSLASTA